MPEDQDFDGKPLKRDQAVIAVIGAANRDPEKYANPDELDVMRSDNRHLAFGSGAHLCFGAPLARLEGQVAFETILNRLRGLRLTAAPVEWRPNLILRGLTALHVQFS